MDDLVLYHYYLIAFNTQVNVDDPMDPKAEVGMEAFQNLGNECQYFEALMGEEDRLPCDAGNVLRMFRLKQRFNPHRHIRIYGVKSEVDEHTLRKLCCESPMTAETIIKDCGVRM